MTDVESAWNPGLTSTIPGRLWPKVTLFSADNAYVSFEQARELNDLTGLDVIELAALKPKRLLMHALLVRVTADLTVADGPDYAELGLNLRHMVKQLYCEHMSLFLPAIESEFSALKMEASSLIRSELEAAFSSRHADQPIQPEKKSLFARWFAKTETENEAVADNDVSDIDKVSRWQEQVAGLQDGLQRTCLKELAKCVGSIVAHRGHMLPDLELVTRITTNRVLNTRGGLIIDAALDDIWQQAIDAEGYRCLPAQDKPVVMNVKGASASGKSTIRPQQRKLADKLGIAWEDFALISPDYWRKYLLDYDSLEDDFKYAAMLTGRELEIVDKKLDVYMAAKAQNGTMSHLLIDRFRFDSFALDSERDAGSKLLSRFGDRIYLFFMITHPVETVARAWLRGGTTGRYKAVDDLLFHNVEAFTGMPSLFLSWVNSRDKQMHFEFLDNDVAKGDLPKTVAFGHNNTLVVLDMSLLFKVDRYCKVNVDARAPEDVFPKEGGSVTSQSDSAFIQRCIKTVNRIVFADSQSMIEYALIESGRLVWWDHAYVQRASSPEVSTDLLASLGYTCEPCSETRDTFGSALDPAVERRFLLGHLGVSG